jgi:hypothetical protein
MSNPLHNNEEVRKHTVNLLNRGANDVELIKGIFQAAAQHPSMLVREYSYTTFCNVLQDMQNAIMDLCTLHPIAVMHQEELPLKEETLLKMVDGEKQNNK